jgi:hypothetical protein
MKFREFLKEQKIAGKLPQKDTYASIPQYNKIMDVVVKNLKKSAEDKKNKPVLDLLKKGQLEQALNTYSKARLAKLPAEHYLNNKGSLKFQGVDADVVNKDRFVKMIKSSDIVKDMTEVFEKILFGEMLESEDFEPHMMYDPKTGKGYKADKIEDHLRMKKLGYGHDKP